MSSVEAARKAEAAKARLVYESFSPLAMKASITVSSHISDAGYATKDTQNHLNFAKFIINKLHGDLTYEIEPQVMWEEFEKNYLK